MFAFIFYILFSFHGVPLLKVLDRSEKYCPAFRVVFVFPLGTVRGAGMESSRDHPPNRVPVLNLPKHGPHTSDPGKGTSTKRVFVFGIVIRV